jgi:hypothetical protein
MVNWFLEGDTMRRERIDDLHRARDPVHRGREADPAYRLSAPPTARPEDPADGRQPRDTAVDPPSVAETARGKIQNAAIRSAFLIAIMHGQPIPEFRVTRERRRLMSITPFRRSRRGTKAARLPRPTSRRSTRSRIDRAGEWRGNGEALREYERMVSQRRGGRHRR